jgi:hypothetical protein
LWLVFLTCPSVSPPSPNLLFPNKDMFSSRCLWKESFLRQIKDRRLLGLFYVGRWISWSHIMSVWLSTFRLEAEGKYQSPRIPLL